MKTVRLICRHSRLSLLQAEIVKRQIESAVPGTMVEIIGRSSRGDRELSVPLSALDGTDFFTEEIFEALQKGEADIAVHSLKDMSAVHFFSHDAFAVIEREDVREVVIFNAAERWKHKGYHAVSNYSLVASGDKNLSANIAAADFIFWSTFGPFTRKITRLHRHDPRCCTRFSSSSSEFNG